MIHNARKEVRNEEGCGAINPCCNGVACEFIINLKAAKQIGLTIPPNVLARADKVIK
jgi:hypothetical protein